MQNTIEHFSLDMSFLSARQLQRESNLYTAPKPLHKDFFTYKIFGVRLEVNICFLIKQYRSIFYFHDIHAC
jgi:hypothetical protein